MDIILGNAFEGFISLLLIILFFVQLSLVILERKDIPSLAGIGLMACLTTLILSGFYVALALDWQPLAGNVEMRLAVFRPTFSFWLVFLIVKLSILAFVWRRRGFSNSI